MFTFRSIGSGSSGNAYLFATDDGYFMIDAGVGIRKLKKYLTETGVSIAHLKALLLTHDHSDHAKNVGTLQQAAIKQGYHLPLYATRKTVEGIMHNPTITKKPISSDTNYIEKEDTIHCCGCTITPFDVPHDSQDDVGFFIRHKEDTLCLVTDVGEITPTIHQYIRKCRKLILEANYDEKMLQTGPYPYHLQQRIRGAQGHLSNTTAAETIERYHKTLQTVWLCHLSENNNTPQSVQHSIDERLKVYKEAGENIPEYHILSRMAPSPVFILSSEILSLNLFD